MTKKTIGAGIAIDGEKEFKSAISGINKDLAVLGSEMGKVTAQFGSNAGSMDALSAKSEVYNKQVETQRQKIEEMKKALENARNEYGENSTQVKNWQISLNKAERDLANTESALSRTTDEAKKLNKADFSKFGESLSKAGEMAGKAAIALGAAAAAAAAGIGAMAVKAAYAADDINTLSKQTGLSTEEIQKFRFASEQIDVPLETLTGSMAKLTRNMESARQGSKNQRVAFEALGVSITDNEGKLRSNQDVFAETIDALGKIENGTQRDAYAMQIFGKSAQDLNPLILGGAEALKQLGDEAEAAGLILSQDALDNLNQLSDAIDTFKATVGASGNLFATAFAGPMAEALNEVTGFAQDISAAFSKGGFGEMAEEVGVVLGKIANRITEFIPEAVSLGFAIVKNLIESLVSMFPELVKAGVEVIVGLAEGISNTIPELIPIALDAVLTIVDTLIENVETLVDAAIAIVVALANGIIEALPKLIEKAPEIVIKLVGAIIENAPRILEAAGELIRLMVLGITENLSGLGRAAGEMVGTVLAGALKLIPEMVTVGIDVVKGLWQGISSMTSWLRDNVLGFVGGMVDGVRNFLGIASPSRVFAGIGGYMAEGLGVGFESKMDTVSKSINKSIPVPEIPQQPDVFGMVSNLMSSQPAGGSTTLTINIDGKQVAKQIYDHLQGESKIRGTAFVAGV